MKTRHCWVVLIGLFCAIILSATTGDAEAALINYLGNDNVIYDDVSGLYWYAPIDNLANTDYADLITNIGGLADVGGLGGGL